MERKVFFGVILALIVVAAVLTAGCIGNDTEKTYVVGIDGDYPPYSYVDESGNFVGFDVESIQWIAEEEEFNVEFKALIREEVIPALLAGKIDMIYSSMTITPERSAQVTFSKPYWIVNQSVAVQNGSTATLDQFKAGHLIIGVQRSCSADQYLQNFFGESAYARMIQDGRIMLYDTFYHSMTALDDGLVDAVIFDDGIMESTLKGDNNFIIIGYIETNEEYGVAMRNDDPELQTLMNDGLSKLMASEKWNELQMKYMIEA